MHVVKWGVKLESYGNGANDYIDSSGGYARYIDDRTAQNYTHIPTIEYV